MTASVKALSEFGHHNDDNGSHTNSTINHAHEARVVRVVLHALNPMKYSWRVA